MSSEGVARQRDIKAKEKRAAELAKAEIDRPEAFERSKRPKTKPKKEEKPRSPEEIAAATVREQTALRGAKIEQPGVKQVTTKSIPLSRRVPKKTIVDVANELTAQAGFVKKTALAQKPVKPTASQLKARLGLAIIEPIIGGVQEATFGAIGPQDRPATALLRLGGALATPTVADALVGVVLQKLTVAPKARRLLKKIKNVITEKIDPLDTLKVVKTLGKVDEIALTDIHKTAIIKPRLLSVNDADELAQLLKLDKQLSKVEFEGIITSLRRGQLDPPLPLSKKSADLTKKAFKNQLDNVIDALSKGFKKSVSLDDPKQAAKAWEEGLTTARRLTQRKIGPDKLPLLEIDFPGANFEAGTITEARRNAIKLLDLRSAANKGSKTLAEIKNFIELNTGPRRGFTTLAPPDLTKIPNAANDLIKFIDDNPTVFQDGTLFSWVLSGMTPGDAKKVLDSTTKLPASTKKRIVAAIEAAGPPSAFKSGKKGPPSAFKGPKKKRDDFGQFSIFDVPPWAEELEKGDKVDAEDEPSPEIVPVVPGVGIDEEEKPIPETDKEKEERLEREMEKGIKEEREKEKEKERESEREKEERKEKEREREKEREKEKEKEREREREREKERAREKEKEKEKQKQEQKLALEEAQLLEEQEELPDETITLRLTEEEKEEREGLETRIMSGPKQKWRVTYNGKVGWIGDARGVVGALDKAQKGRRAKKQPDIIVVELVKIK